MLATAKTVSDKLREKKYSPALFDARCVKPICQNLISDLKNFDFIFTIEDGIKTGGFGERINATHAFAFPDIFPETGTRKELFARYNLDAESIYKKIIEETTNGKQKKTQSGN
jgi:1-deoxy-D-xylulose-5-phosphate synthase